MSTTFDDWTKAKSRLNNAQQRIRDLHRVVEEAATHLDAWLRIQEGATNTIMIPNFSSWPTVEALRGAAQEFSAALLEEFNAFNRCPYSEQQQIKRNSGEGSFWLASE
jgi:hypothetical protein